MTAHTHTSFVEGCFRCDLSREEVKPPTETCDCGDCAPRATDCCDVYRWACETVQVLDGAGDPDVVVCRKGYGCDTAVKP